MNLVHYLDGKSVSLSQLLEARERRVLVQQKLLQDYSLTVISFTLNIVGSIKTFPLALQAFEEGLF